MGDVLHLPVWPKAVVAFDTTTEATSPSWTEHGISGGEPGYVAVAGQFSGFDLSRSNDTGAVALALVPGMIFTNESPFYIRRTSASVSIGAGKLYYFPPCGAYPEPLYLELIRAFLGFSTADIGDGFVFNDVAGAWQPLRQPDSFQNNSNLQSAVGLGTTGVKASIVTTQDYVLDWASMVITTAVVGSATIELQIVRAATTFRLGAVATGAAAIDAEFGLLGTTTSGKQFDGISGDTVRLNVIANATSGNADLSMTLRAQRAAFN